MTTGGRQESVPIIQRKSLCLSSSRPGIASHCGEDGFSDSITKYFSVPENNVAEQIVELKAELRAADTETFWRRLMEGMTDICHAQYGFVAKRILVDDHDAAVEMPPIGEPGSCLLGVAFFYNDGKAIKGMRRDYKYLAWGAPCANMRHDKVFLIPEKLSSFVTNNPNAFPFPTEAYFGVPLFSEGRCFAHFGMMWTQEGLAKKELSWGYLEMLLHSLEDMILQRLLTGQGFSRRSVPQFKHPSKVIPQGAITTSQSLKPYARSLSHELRTPMQGVVGMLDVMHATVQEAIEGATSSKIRNTFQALKENIEVVQDSSRRAVEAADNVVHAYDLNMQIPDTPQNESDSPATNFSSTAVFDNRPNILIEGSNIPVNPYKRRRSSPVEWHFGTTPKVRDVKQSPRREISPRSEDVRSAVHEGEALLHYTPERELSPSHMATKDPATKASTRRGSARYSVDVEAFPIPGIRNTRIRELVPIVINEALRVGGRPDSAITEPTIFGEQIEVRTRSSNGVSSQKTIEWSVHPDIPETLLVDERDLAKLVSRIFLNALKFTDCGRITLNVRPSSSMRYILINVVDTGSGIPEDFQPELFKPFSREDDSLTRSTEGLGLGLMVAKGLARRIGGDLTLVRSETSGPNKGSDFEVKVPVDSADIITRPGTPYDKTPTPSRGSIDASRKDASFSSRKAVSPLQALSPSRHNSHTPNLTSTTDTPATPITRRLSSTPKASAVINKNTFDRKLAEKYPLTFLVAEDNKLNRKLLVSMLGKFGYKDVYEAFDGKEAVRIMMEVNQALSSNKRGTTQKQQAARKVKPIDVVLMDLWMPEMDGYEATERILQMFDTSDGKSEPGPPAPTILAVSADVTDEAIDRATRTGMEGFMTKPYKLMDLQRLIEEFCVGRESSKSAS
jgi:signal transduction histidine kinase/DNA-binding NarL/FixJ family response regulator